MSQKCVGDRGGPRWGSLQSSSADFLVGFVGAAPRQGKERREGNGWDGSEREVGKAGSRERDMGRKKRCGDKEGGMTRGVDERG